MTYFQVMIFVIPIAVLLKILAICYARKYTFLYRFCIGSLEILCVCGINILMVIYLGGMQNSCDVGTPIACAVITGILAIALHAMNLLGERKYPLSDQQISELLDQ